MTGYVDPADATVGPSRSALGIAGLAEVVPLGSGGSATVYRARQVAFDRTVAVKLLAAPVSDSAAHRRFEREQQLTGRLTGHPNIARVFDSGFTSAGQPYLVMEFYGGGTLRDAVSIQGRLDPSVVLSIGVRLAGALSTAHEAGILHRDVKPANVLLDRSGEPHLADFGISGMAGESAELTHANTTRYAAPEVLSRTPDYSASADQYSLALTLLFLATGDPPASAEPITRADALGIPAPLRNVLARALSEQPEQRFATVADFGKAMQEAQRALCQPITPLRVLDASSTPMPTPQPTGPATHPSSRPGGSSLPGTPADELTRMRHAPPAPVTSHRARTRTIIISAAIFVVVVAIAAVAGIFFRSGGGEVQPPSDLKITRDSATQITVSWADTNYGTTPYGGYVVTGGQNPGTSKSPDFVTNKGATSVVAPAPPAGAKFCVMVFPIVSETAEDRLDHTATACQG